MYFPIGSKQSLCWQTFPLKNWQTVLKTKSNKYFLTLPTCWISNLSQCVYYVKMNKIQTASFRCANNCRYTRNSLTRNIVALVKVHFRTEQAYTVQITHAVSTNKDVHMWSATFVHEMFYLSYVSLMGPDRADPRHHTSTTNITTTTNTNSTWAQVMYWSCGKPSHCAWCSIEDVTAWEKGSVYRNDLDLQEDDVHAL